MYSAMPVRDPAEGLFFPGYPLPLEHIKRMCLGTFSRRGAVALATIYPCAECASPRSVFIVWKRSFLYDKKTRKRNLPGLCAVCFGFLLRRQKRIRKSNRLLPSRLYCRLRSFRLLPLQKDHRIMPRWLIQRKARGLYHRLGFAPDPEELYLY